MAQSHAQKAGAVAETYARSVFDLAQQGGSVAEVGDELKQIASLIEHEKGLAALFAHRTIPADRKAASIESIFNGRVSELTLRLLLVLNRHARLDQISSIARAFDKLLKDSRGQVDVEVHTAQPLDAGQLAAVTTKLSNAMGKTAVVHPRLDPSLIGGLKIRIGDKLIDASVTHQLARIKQQLNERGQQLARSSTALVQEG
ncbi:MAG: ATP synthase F1 subunit delta [Planctomycetes bacterium]|nr:ATP synthase F1 subunit delta [Planctomycetota bacterium]